MNNEKDEKCICACHDNVLKRPYGHDAQCCENMNGYIEIDEKDAIIEEFANCFGKTWNDSTYPEPSLVYRFLYTALDRYGEEVRREVIEEVFEIEKEKWTDAVHCTCLGYTLVQLAGGEDSEGGKKMEERLSALTTPNPKEE